jgi:uncharacterized membrane protein
MKNKILTTLFLCTITIGFSQQKITWEDLAKVTFTEKYFPSYDDLFLYPEFSNEVKSLEGKKITITGYFLSIAPKQNLYILSKGPLSSCFFCGVGGPETAVEIQFANKPSFKTDEIISVTGVLKLNKDEVEHFNYILKNCIAQKLD